MHPLASSAGILAALFIAGLIGIAGSDQGHRLSEFPVFMICGILAFTVQWLAFVPAWLYRTERYFDLTGSLTYTALILLVLGLGAWQDPRSLVIGALVMIWAARLGSFLFLRVNRDGGDRRFNRIKNNFMQFLMTWTIQGLWVYITLAAALAAMTSTNTVKPDWMMAAGILCWITGFSIEVIADQQKAAFRRSPENHNRFITEGLWSLSRHPNYFGEILLWIGIAAIALPVLQGWQYLTLVSPVFVFLLLTRISGVTMLESRADRQWGNDPDYQSYRDSTPMLIPRLRQS